MNVFGFCSLESGGFTLFKREFCVKLVSKMCGNEKKEGLFLTEGKERKYKRQASA
jgi:hypothetical protein